MDIDKASARLVDLLYDAGMGNAPWEWVLTEARLALRGQSALIFTSTMAGEEIPLCFTSGELQVSDLDLVHRAGGDLWVQRALERNLLRNGFVGRGSDVVHQDELRKSTFYNDALVHLNVEHVCSSAMQDRTPDAMLGFLSVLRAREAGDFSDADVEVQRRIGPHARRALSMWSRVAGYRKEINDLRATLELVPFGMAIVRADRVVVHLNAEAERLFCGTGPLKLARFAGNWLLVPTQGTGSPAARALQSILGGQATPSWRLECSAGQAPWFVDSMPLGHRPGERPQRGGGVNLGWESRRSFVITVLASNKQPPFNGYPLQRFFGLTKAEATLAETLMVSEDLSAAASSLQVSRNTAKTHLASIFEKTGTRTQSQLTRLLARLPARPEFES